LEREERPKAKKGSPYERKRRQVWSARVRKADQTKKKQIVLLSGEKRSDRGTTAFRDRDENLETKNLLG